MAIFTFWHNSASTTNWYQYCSDIFSSFGPAHGSKN